MGTVASGWQCGGWFYLGGGGEEGLMFEILYHVFSEIKLEPWSAHLGILTLFYVYCCSDFLSVTSLAN